MKTLKIPLAILAIVFAVAGVFAFNTAEKKVKLDPVSYHYTSNSNNVLDMKDINNWEVADPACDEEGNRPCVIVYEGNISAFESYLQTFPTAGAITLRADEKKTVQ